MGKQIFFSAFFLRSQCKKITAVCQGNYINCVVKITYFKCNIRKYISYIGVIAPRIIFVSSSKNGILSLIFKYLNDIKLFYLLKDPLPTNFIGEYEF